MTCLPFWSNEADAGTLGDPAAIALQVASGLRSCLFLREQSNRAMLFGKQLVISDATIAGPHATEGAPGRGFAAGPGTVGADRS